MQTWITWLRTSANGALDGATDGMLVVLLVVVALLAIVGIVSLGVSIWLGFAYRRYNRQDNQIGQTGEEIARQLLDARGLFGIRVTCSGSILFGNSYSRHFKRVCLRRRTWQRSSVAALAMAAQKSALAVLDYEEDRVTRIRMRLMPFLYLGPLAFIPLLALGVLLNVALLGAESDALTITAGLVGILLYLVSFGMSLLVLKSEKKAQERAVLELRHYGMATEEEIAQCKYLFRLYNIEYVNNVILSLLEVIYRVLLLLARMRGGNAGEGN